MPADEKPPAAPFSAAEVADQAARIEALGLEWALFF